MPRGRPLNPPPLEPESASVESVTRMEKSLTLLAAACKDAGKPLRLRLAIALFDPASCTYRGWRGMTWKINVNDADGARELQSGLESFFDLVETAGPERAKEWVEWTKTQLNAAIEAEAKRTA
jgi:hypothetical protein